MDYVNCHVVEGIVLSKKTTQLGEQFFEAHIFTEAIANMGKPKEENRWKSFGLFILMGVKIQRRKRID